MASTRIIRRGSRSRPGTALSETEPCRINKFFTRQGACSRREADRLIQANRVTINGRVAKVGDVVTPNDVIALDGLAIPWGKESVYIKYHKPVGITTTTESQVPGNIIAAIGHPERIFPIGRLDKDSSGLILLTNNGEIVNRILRAEHGHEREYVVQVDHSYDQAFLRRMAEGVVILGKQTKPCRVTRLGPRRFRILLTEGRNRQIRRMCQTLGFRVVELQRTRIMGIRLEGLAVGQWKTLTRDELIRVFADIERALPATSQ